MLKKTTIIILLLLLLPACFSVQEKVIRAEWVKSGTKIELINPQIVMDNRMTPVKDGIYLIKLKDSSGKTLYQLKTFQPVNISPPPMDYTSEQIEEWFKVHENNYSAPVFLPYLEGVEKMTLEHGISILAELDLSVLCNKDGYCDKTENNLSCPGDCPLETEDEYCLADKDGVCDPDCMAGIDPDCGKDVVEPEPEQDFVMLILLAAIVIVIVLIFLSRWKK